METKTDTSNSKLFAAHEPDLSECSDTVKERFAEMAEHSDEYENAVHLLDDMEEAMIGYTENASGKVVPVYEYNLCIRCLKEMFAKDLADCPEFNYTPEQLADPDFIDEEATTMAQEWFDHNTRPSLPYLRDEAPIIINGFMTDLAAWEAMRKA